MAIAVILSYHWSLYDLIWAELQKNMKIVPSHGRKSVLLPISPYLSVLEYMFINKLYIRMAIAVTVS